MPKVSVACIAYCNGKILIAHRNPVGVMGDRWEFPGGKCEPDETEQQAVVRELQEEFGITVTVRDRIAEAEFCHNGEQCVLHAYSISVPHDGIQIPYTLTEHSEYAWVPLADIPSLHFVDSDMKLYPAIQEYVSGLQ
jgi:8-oxo-dGTP diphosphatase